MDNQKLIPPIDPGDSVLPALRAHSLTYRFAVGLHHKHKAFTVQTLPPQELLLALTQYGESR